MYVCVQLWITCFCSPAGPPSGMWGGPGKPIGVPVMGYPYEGELTPVT